MIRWCVIWSIIVFFSCVKKTSTPSPISNSLTPENLTISGTWVLYQYQTEGTTVLVPKSDTLQFSPSHNYTYNGVSSNYYLYDMSTAYRITLKNTPFGDMTTLLPYNFQTSGSINGIKFSTTNTSPTTSYFMWIRKL